MLTLERHEVTLARGRPWHSGWIDEEQLLNDTQPDPGSPPGMPRWLKVSLIIAAVIALVLVVLALTGGIGDHGPSRHSLGMRG